MEKILVIDFGSQYTHLIARRIRQLKVYSEIKQPNITLKELKDAKGIILSGGPNSVYEKNSQKINKKILDLKIPILGICYGHQLISHLLGGKLESGSSREYGFAKLETEKNILFKGLERNETVWMSHGDHVKQLPKGFKTIGQTNTCENVAVYNKEKNIYGLQFHPEVTHTKNGIIILDNFLKICNIKKTWNVDKYLENIKQEIKDKVKNKNVFLLVSGGVDSLVAFRLLKEALGKEKVLGLHIDNGFMRLKESCHIMKELKNLDLNTKIVVSKEFLKKIDKTTDPENKRKIIGKTFIDVTNKAIKDLKLKNWILAQGTIYPDTIESGDTKSSAKIKTHHNRVNIIKKLIDEGKIIEPLKDFYKDEVRMLGKRLGLPLNTINRHPFPGPGLAIRCLCQEKTHNISKTLQNRVNSIAEGYFLNAKVLPVKSVGVQGDSRSYKNPVMLIGQTDWTTLDKVATEICNKVTDVNRVILRIAGDNNLNPKKAYLTKKRLDLLREIDLIVRRFIWKKGYQSRIWQMPVVLIPLGSKGKESIVLRPICSTEVMTANFTRMELEDVKMLANEIIETNKISTVLYDITNKPPGTVEWE